MNTPAEEIIRVLKPSLQSMTRKNKGERFNTEYGIKTEEGLIKTVQAILDFYKQ